jgi:signal transduction histidine kinase/YHS domain-containing protein
MIHHYFWELCYILVSILIVTNLWMYFRVLRPIRQLAGQAKQLNTGDFQAIETVCGGIFEIQSLQRSMVGMVRHVRHAQEQSVKYADNLTTAQETERLRIARELHDETIQSLIVISQSIDMAKTWLQSKPEQSLQMLNAAREEAVETVTNLRGLIEALRPPVLEELGLVAALEMLGEKYDLPLDLQIEGTKRRLDDSQELAVFRCVQESLSNAKRHSQASQVHLRLSYSANQLQVTIQDNGRGFALPQQLTDFADLGHYGLMGIQERMKQLHGSMSLSSSSDMGTSMVLILPFKPVEQPENTVRDPVCSALIQPQEAYASSLHDGERYYFCCPICQGAFHKEPERYIHSRNLTNAHLSELL